MDNGVPSKQKKGLISFHFTFPVLESSQLYAQQPLRNAKKQAQLGDFHSFPFWEHALRLSCS